MRIYGKVVVIITAWLLEVAFLSPSHLAYPQDFATPETASDVVVTPLAAPRNFSCTLQDHPGAGLNEFILFPTGAFLSSPLGGFLTLALDANRAEILQASVTASSITIAELPTGNIAWVLDPAQPSHGQIDQAAPLNLSTRFATHASPDDDTVQPANVTIRFGLRLNFVGGSISPRSFFGVPVLLNAMVSGDNIQGSITGVLPSEVPLLGNSSFTMRIFCKTGTQGQLRATFTLDGVPHPVSLTISDGAFVKILEGVTAVDETVPSNATYSIEWVVASGRQMKDVVGLQVPPAGALDLNFYLFRPENIELITPFLFAEEVGANAVVSNSFNVDPATGMIQLGTEITGAPNKLLILDVVLARRTNGAFAFVEGPLVGWGGCIGNPGQPYPPIPMGPPLPPPPPVPQPNSSTEDDGSCDVNYGLKLGLTGQLRFGSTLRELQDSVIALATTLRNAASISATAFEVEDTVSNRVIAFSPASVGFEVSAGFYILSFDVPKESNPRDTYRLALPVEAMERRIHSITAFPSTARDLQDFTPLVVGDSRLGLGTTIVRTTKSERLAELRIDAKSDDMGWVLVPFPQHVCVTRIVKVSDANQTELTERKDFTRGTVERHGIVILKVEQGEASYVIQLSPSSSFGGPSGCLTGFSSIAHDVGRGSGRTGIRIVGSFLPNRKVDLDAATALTITALLDDGVEDVNGLPLLLIPDARNNATTAYFKTAVGVVPIAKVTIHDRGRNEFTFRIEVSKATGHPSAQCPNTTLTTAFVIADGVNAPVAVSTQQPWLCFGRGDQFLKSPP